MRCSTGRGGSPPVLRAYAQLLRVANLRGSMWLCAAPRSRVCSSLAVNPVGTSPKFYQDVTLAPLSNFTVEPKLNVPLLPPGSTGWVVLLGAWRATCCEHRLSRGVRADGRGMVTPFGNLLVVPTEALALGIAGEWASQEERIKPGETRAGCAAAPLTWQQC